jgi:RNA polymerase sigma-70 factor (ECF subfamily)
MLTTATSATLLLGLKEGKATVWRDYVDRYRPLLVAYGLRMGLEPADAEDAEQEILVAFAESYRQDKFDPAKGRLRAWLFGIAQLILKNARRRRAKLVGREQVQRTGALEQVPGEDRWEAIWEEEWRDAVLEQALAEVRCQVTEQTYAAFQLFALQGLPADQVAERLAITQNAVFGAKRRVLERLKAILPAMEEAW